MTRLMTLAAAALVLVGGGLYWQSTQTGGTAAGLPGLNMAHAQSVEIDTSVVEEMTMGDESAPVTVIEYASFTCPHCKNFHNDVFKELKANYIDTGKVHFIYREVYFDRFGLWAGMVARCGGAEKYFGISNLIYEQQETWTKGESPAVIAENLAKIGRTAGLDGDAVDTCLQDGEMAQAMVAVYQENADRDGIRSTPSFIIDGNLHKNMSYKDFAELLDAKLPD